MGNIGGKYQPMASLLGAGGWSGITYSWDSYFPQVAALNEGQTQLIEDGFNKIIDEITQTPEPFINFGYDQKCYEGAGRYASELHETAAGPATILLIAQFANRFKSTQYQRDTLFPIIKKYTLAQKRGFFADSKGYYKPTEYTYNGQLYKLRSLESDRKGYWFTDLALAYQALFSDVAQMAEAINDADTSILALKQIANKMYIPQTPTCYRMFDNDNFQNIPKNGWEHSAYNYPTAVIATYPFGNLLSDKKLIHTIDTMYKFMTNKTQLINWGGYPLVAVLAAQRLGRTDLVAKMLSDTNIYPISKKVSVKTGNSVEDNDSFLMSFAALQVLLQETFMWVKADTAFVLPIGNFLGNPLSATDLAGPKQTSLSFKINRNQVEVNIKFQKKAKIYVLLPNNRFGIENENKVKAKKIQKNMVELQGEAYETLKLRAKI